MTASVLHAQFPSPVAQPKTDTVHLVDERGSAIKTKPSLMSLYLGNRFALDSLESTLGNPNAAATATAFAQNNMVRASELIYKGTATLADSSGAFVAQPTLRAEYERPFQSLQWLSLLFSLEGSFAMKRDLVSSGTSFRYENAQANHLALTNVTYAGQLTASDTRYTLTPMVGLGFEITNSTLQKASGLSFILHLSGGVGLMSAKRSYDLVTTPQAISAGSYSDTYQIKSTMTQSFQMAILGAGRIDLGMRVRLGQSGMHLALVGSATFYYGVLPYDNYGYFSETAGNRQIYQKITTGTADETYIGLAPAIFLALSREL